MLRALDKPPFHLFALTALAVAQPLFDLLGRQPEFLIAHHLQRGDILALVVLVFLGPPAVLIAATEVIGWTLSSLLGRESLRDLSYAAAVSLLATLFVLLAVRQLPMLPGGAHLPVAVIVGVLAGAGYRRSAKLRLFLALLAPLVLVVPLVFLFLTPVVDRWAPSPSSTLAEGAVAEEIPRPVPVVLAVFDELPTSSLVGADGRIDAGAFPSFAELAATSNWYRDATSVASLTLAALPAILSGQYPRAGALPTLRDHPKNLMSLLSRHYAFHVLEPHTELTPRRHAADPRRWSGLIRDLAVLYPHLVAPPPLARRLPPITTWRLSRLPDKAEDFRRAVEGIQRGRQPPLVFIHSDLPHHPWIYLPSGKRYLTAGEFIIDGLEHGRGPASARWTKDEWPVIQAYQRHLLQLAFTDRLLGELLARLRRLDLFDPALIIVAADHGVSFTPGGHMRKADLENFAEIMPVPLFVKLPGQRQGETRDGSVELIDVLPTIRDVLGLPPDPSLPGISLLGELPAERAKHMYHTPRHQLRFPSYDPSHVGNVARRRRLLFPAESSPPFFHPATAFRQLLGRSAVATRTARGFEARIDDASRFDHVDLEAEGLPCRVSGRLLEHPDLRATPPGESTPGESTPGESTPGASTPGESTPVATTVLAVAINGRIQALTRTRRDAGYAGRFSAMVPEAALRGGQNRLELFRVTTESGAPALEPVALEPTVTYELVLDAAGQVEALRSSGGRRHPIDPGTFEGRVTDVVFVDRGYRAELVGWARDEDTGAVPEVVAVFNDGRWIHTGHPNLTDPAVAASYSMPGKEGAGFVFLIPLSETEGAMRFFAIAEGGVATELPYRRSMKPKPSRFVD